MLNQRRAMATGRAKSSVLRHAHPSTGRSTWRTIVISRDPGSCDGAPTTIRYEEFAIPDVAAQRLWLTNRRPDRWRDLLSKEISGPGGGAIQVDASNMTDLEAARRSAFAVTRLLLALPAPPTPDEDD